MQKKYSSDNTVHLTKGDLNSIESLKDWLEKNFGQDIKNIETPNLISALEGILTDKNFIELNEDKKHDFITDLNKIKEQLEKFKSSNK